MLLSFWVHRKAFCREQAKTSPINIPRTHVVRLRATFQPIFRCHVSCRVKHVRDLSDDDIFDRLQFYLLRRLHRSISTTKHSFGRGSFKWNIMPHSSPDLFPHLPPFVACRSQSNGERVWNTFCAAFFLRHVYANCGLVVLLSLAPIDGRVRTANFRADDIGDENVAKKNYDFNWGAQMEVALEAAKKTNACHLRPHRCAKKHKKSSE